MKKRILFTVAIVALIVQNVVAQNIVITEISYNGPEAGSDSTEFIELYNNGTTAVNMSGYSFTQGIVYTFPAITINAGSFLVIAVDSFAIQNVFGVSARQWTAGGLSNGGEDIILIDGMGNTVDSVDYDDNAPWPVGPPSPDGGGPTIELSSPSSDNSMASNWGISTSAVSGVIVNGNQVYGTPGSFAMAIPTLVTSTQVDSNVTCNGFANGGATTMVSNGTAPFTYAWSNMATTPSITGVSAGKYYVTVMDMLGASGVDSITITEPAVMSSSIVVTNVSMVGLANGALDLTVTGGTPLYTYSWSNAATTEDINSLIAGTYTVTITDVNGCSHVNSSTVMGPAAVVISISSTDVSCNGGNDGTATVTASGGTAPFTYLWSDAQTTSTSTSLSEGKYFVTVTDNIGTSAIDSVIIAEPTALNIASIVTNASSATSNDGAINLTVTGGVAPYSFNWSPGSGTTQSITNLAAGNYCVSVTDANGCFSVGCEDVLAPGTLANLIISEINYNGPESGTDTSEFIEFVNAGSTTVNLNGYSFSQGVGYTFGANDSILAGQYFVIAVDSSTFRNRYGLNANAVWTSGGLSNGGEDITIVDDFGRTVDSVDFDDNSPWPSGALTGQPDGGGASIELVDSSLNNNDGLNWRAASNPIVGQIVNGNQVFGTPGARPIIVGISELPRVKNNINIYPNPSEGIITIESTLEQKSTHFQIISIDGKMLRDGVMNQSRLKLDLSSYANGIYFLRIGNTNQKLILNK